MESGRWNGAKNSISTLSINIPPVYPPSIPYCGCMINSMSLVPESDLEVLSLGKSQVYGGVSIDYVLDVSVWSESTASCCVEAPL